MSDEDIVNSVTTHGLSGGEADHFVEENEGWLRGRKTPYGTVVPLPIGFRPHAVSTGGDADHIIPSGVEDMIRRNTEPKTPTGKRYWDLEEWDGDPADILAIEREARDEGIVIGRQQERERLRAKPILGDWDSPPYPLPEWVKTPTPKGEAPIDLLTHFRDWLLADPEEADR